MTPSERRMKAEEGWWDMAILAAVGTTLSFYSYAWNLLLVPLRVP